MDDVNADHGKRMKKKTAEKSDANVLITTINASMSQSTFSYLLAHSMDNLFSYSLIVCVEYCDFSNRFLIAVKRFLILKLLCFASIHRLFSATLNDIKYQFSYSI